MLLALPAAEKAEFELTIDRIDVERARRSLWQETSKTLIAESSR